ncbi:rho GTPase-activating protein gacU [Drosophila innubila]|uniref:rho GTPase-activating protein gacU n=1 Tax=Drosophila innubila TaxID=198719 RepID=UPI00148E1537|nr:rho GTPase-activating protein gacU [Drosophila innubila]
MVSKALLLLVAIVAARFGGSTRRTTLALACDESLAAAATTTQQNNRYNSYYSNNNNKNNMNNNNNEQDNNDDGIADSKDSNVDDDNNDNYNYNKASAKWQLAQQKLYGNPQSIHQQQQQQEQQQQLQRQQQLRQHHQQQQFVDDSEAAGNDFLLQLPVLNAAMQGVDWFSQDTSNNNDKDTNNNNNHNNDYDYNVWHATSESEREHLPLQRSSRSSYKQSRQTAGNGDGDGDIAGGQLDADADGIDFEGEEDFAVAKMDADELSEQLPYGIQNVRKRRVRSVMPPPQSQYSTTASGSEGVTYQSLCPTKRVTVKLDNGEYRPNHYVEVTCANNYAPLPPRLQNYDNYNYRSNELPLLRALLNERSGEKREICSATGFACIQLNRTIHLIRLNEGSGCWESETRTVPSGCECMWPKHSYGDIASYHQAQKRFTNQRARPGPIIDYTPGVGYRQLTLRSHAPKSGGVAAGTRSRRADLDYDNY